ncbi:hypothetical protein [Geoalkalibacter halelectricus]|uniref:hypothetical protein n=1 Tax=Geoalkalibacter halelectricus TaxID=2847045 RepID=UPI003D24F906
MHSENSPPPPPENPQPKKHSKQIGIFLLLCLLVSCLTSVLTLYLYDRHFVQKIVAVDLSGYVAEQRELYLANRITDAELHRRMDLLAQVVDEVPSHHVVLMADGVVRNIRVIRP